MLKKIIIQDRVIGDNSPPFIIAEAGINHEGEFNKAIQLVDAAVRAKADCIKFQCHITESEMVKTKMKPGGISDETLWDIIKRCELTLEEEFEIKEYCDKKKIIYLCTPFSREASDRLESINISAFKIGSGECNNIPLIDHIAAKGKPIILSTGMNDIESIQPSVEIINKHNIPFVLTHCTSMYPTPYDKVRLAAIKHLRDTFNVPVGLSDHSLGIYTCLGAVALGACVLEKHFTISKEWPGPDIPISITTDELAELVNGARAIFEAGGGIKNILKEEQPVIDFAYASVCSISDIKKGKIFTKNNIWIKRPGVGEIHARDFKKVLGKKCKNDIKNDSLMKWQDIEN